MVRDTNIDSIQSFHNYDHARSSSGGAVNKGLACGARGPGLKPGFCHFGFRDLESPAWKS